ncbi:MAG TPA: T9SS type A sorting domain-containing protein, partial [Chitinophagales bacterium]|nr:T9SS type A sorting domain-containing protein [Chitinophagales bacterium]
ANLGTGYTYVWKKNGVVIAGETTNVYIATTTGNYRVTVTNASGCSKTSANTTVVQTCRNAVPIVGDETMEVFPNPASDIVHIHVSGIEGIGEIAKIIVSDLTGQQMIVQDALIIDGDIDIDLKTNELPSGVYLVTVNGAEAQLSQQLVISR